MEVRADTLSNGQPISVEMHVEVHFVSGVTRLEAIARGHDVWPRAIAV